MNELLKISTSDGGGGIFLVVFLEQLGLPIPAAPWLIAAGALCADSGSSPATAIGATVLACLTADLAWFHLGRRKSGWLLDLFSRRGWLSSRSLDQMRRRLAGKGSPLVALAKFVPGVSLVVPPLAGAVGMRCRDFLLSDALGSLLYAGFYLLLGSAFSVQVQAALEIFGRLSSGSILTLAVVAIAWFTFGHRPRRHTA
jgi:membrane protein DedA with SNARE-associated domain